MSPTRSMGTPRDTPRETRIDDEVLEPAYGDLSLGPSGRPVATVVLQAMDPGVVTGGTGPGAAPMGTTTAGTGPGEANTAAALEVAADSPMRLSTSLSSMERGRTVAREERRRAPSTASAGTTDARLDRLTGLMEAMLVRMDDERRSQGGSATAAVGASWLDACCGAYPAFAEHEVRRDDGSQASFHSAASQQGPTAAASGGDTILMGLSNAERPVTPVRPRIVRYPLTPGGSEIKPPDSDPPRTPPPVLRVPSLSPPRPPPLPNFPVEEIPATRGVRSVTPPPAVFRPPVPTLPFSAKSEEPSRYVQALPKLEDYTPDQGAVILGDWLVTITPVIGSLTPGAATWFAEVLARVNEHYALWLASDPVTRLTIRTRAIADGANASSQGGTALLEQRLTTLLLEAVPGAVKTEVITVRALTTVGILFLLHTRYQPAGQAEKASILQFLVSPDAPKDTQQAVKNLRRWLRWLARSTELQLAPPDASLLVKAVDKLGAAFLSDPSAVFRVQAFRLQNSIDHLPSQDSSVSLAQLYLAELETLLLVTPDPKKQRVAALEAPTADKPEEPKGKGKGKEKGGKPNEGAEKEVCRQFSSEKGCPRGNTCKYVHQTHTGMSGRCFNCGGKHLKSECTSPGGYAVAKAKADAKKAVRRTQADKPSPGVGEAQSPEPEAAGSTLGPSAAQAIRDAASSLRQELLKAIRSAEPGNQASGALCSSGKGLIDGGATCCLRSAKNTFEWNEATPTSIRLAVGEVTARVSPAGTLLLPPGSACDPIVALHELIRIGYRMTFLSVNKMRIWRPGQPDLPLDCSTGCPEITPHEANRLITEIENSRRVNRAQVARLTQLPLATFEDALQDPSGDKLALWFKGIVPSVPARLLPTLAVAPCKKAAPWNRRRRRTLSRAKHLIIHLFPGQSRGLFRSLTQAKLGWDVLEVDIEEDLLREDTFGFLLHLAQTGRVRAVIGGPPCRTFSALHHLNSGPPPVRGVGGDAWGLPGLSAATQAMVDQDSALYLRMFMLTSVARRAGRALRRSESPDWLKAPLCFPLIKVGLYNLCVDRATSSSSAAAPSRDSPPREPAADAVPSELLDIDLGFDALFDEEGEASEDPLPVLDVPADPKDLCDPLTPSQTAAADAENQAWQEQFEALTDEWKGSPLPAVAIQDVPYFVPLENKSGKNVSSAIMMVVTQIRALGFPVHRLRSDRGREFRNSSLAHFSRFHCLTHTTTTGDDYRANGRTENVIRQLKRATRTLLRAHDAPPSAWSFAMRHACARLRASALSVLGCGHLVVTDDGYNIHDRGSQDDDIYYAYVTAAQVLWDQRFRDWILDPELRFVVAEDPAEASEDFASDKVAELDLSLEKLLFTTRLVIIAHPTATFSALAVIGDLWIEDASVPEEEAVHRFVPSPQGEPFFAPTVRALFHDWAPFTMPSEPASVYECIAASVALDKCRESVLQAYDFVQYNLKKLGRQARHLWGQANDTGDGEEVAELVRSIDHQVCSLERVLERASPDTTEAPPLLPDAAEKELACFLKEEEDTPPPQLCVARAVDPSAVQSTEVPPNAPPEDSHVPLQTRTVTLVEVLSELELWLPSWKEEYNSLVHQHKAVRPLAQTYFDRWRREGVEYQLIPSKLVHTLKAHTGRRKARCVCCGNMESHSIYHKHECYAGGADATTLRALLRVASAHRWAVSSFDVRTAFLQSRLLTANRVPTVVKVPWLWRKHCICIEEFWLVEGALYGLCISPRSWCESLDGTMASASTTFDDMKVTLVRFETDPNVWWVKGVKPSGETTVLGCVAWYIDDALILAEPDYSRRVTEFVAGLWSTTPPEYLVPGQVLVYNGFEIEQDGPYLHLHQRSFVAELLSRYPGHENSEVPAVPRSGPVQEEERDAALTRKCQALCGEMLWLSIRTRPDLSFAVSMMAQCMAARPNEAWERGLQMLKFLRRHPGVALGYGPPSSSLAVASAMSDASFAPDASRSHQCSLTFLGGSLITWSSGRQNFITQSTCEAELVALVQGLQDLESQLPLFKELLQGSPVECHLLCDNKAAVAICQAPFGSWRSRHLHVRANVVKERLAQWWTLQHLPGLEMLADIGTKPLGSSRLLELMLGLGLHVPEQRPPTVATATNLFPQPTSVPESPRTGNDPRIQRLIRALVLLELIEFLPLSEASDVMVASDGSGRWPSYILPCLGLASWWCLRGNPRRMLGFFGCGVFCAVTGFYWNVVTTTFWILSGVCLVIMIGYEFHGQTSAPTEVTDGVEDLPRLEPLDSSTESPRAEIVVRYTDDLVLLVPPSSQVFSPTFTQVMIGSGRAEAPEALFHLLDLGSFGRMQLLNRPVSIIFGRTLRDGMHEELSIPRLPFLGDNSNHWEGRSLPATTEVVTTTGIPDVLPLTRTGVMLPDNNGPEAGPQTYEDWAEMTEPPLEEGSDDSSLDSEQRALCSAAAFLVNHGYTFDETQFTDELRDYFYGEIGHYHLTQYRDP
ncbi:Copia protein [Symbiodinium microadriaticum]|uniref:Copia protein n=1 Tax=Symbiodinium microadriaticum TaxID=2951 RepID=A0A1Q9E938_SYMMI|nr:Copia protein [Symbiodinium microadriaticum]